MASNDFPDGLQQRRNQLSEIEVQLQNLQDKRGEFARAVKDYKVYQPDAEREKLVRLIAKASGLSIEISNAERSKAALDGRLEEVRSKQMSPVLFWKFFTEAQKRLRAEARRFQRKISAVSQRIEDDRNTLTDTNTQADLTRKHLVDHEKFDLESTVKLLSGLITSIERTEANHTARSAELAHIENRIRPHVQEYERLKFEVSALNLDIVAANDFERRLNDAANGYDRKMIHQDCDTKFGTGSPRQVIKERSGQIRSLENNIPKLERRIHEEFRRSVRKIEHLLIDGNNVCYEGQSFIELRALSGLLTALAGRYMVTIVFDASIRSLLKARTQDISRHLGSSVTTHIAPTKTGADEYLLKLAGKNKSSFILSNDRYAEYHEYDAVKSGRLLRFLIADGKLMVNDLDIMVNI